MMLKLYYGSFVYDDSDGELILRCGHCGKEIVDRLGIHAISGCSTGWGEVERQNRVAKLTKKSVIAKAGLACVGKYSGRKAPGLLFASPFKPADVLVYLPLTSPGVPPGLPKAIDFLVTRPFATTNVPERSIARKSAVSAEAYVDGCHVQVQRVPR